VGTYSDALRRRRNFPRRLCVSAALTNAFEFTQTVPCLRLHTQLTLITPLHTQRIFRFDYIRLLLNVYLSVQNHYPHLASKQGMGTPSTAIKKEGPPMSYVQVQRSYPGVKCHCQVATSCLVFPRFRVRFTFQQVSVITKISTLCTQVSVSKCSKVLFTFNITVFNATFST
jgi:hypothetical protein